MTLSMWHYVACGLAAGGAGAVNALAGGGTLISFPILTAFGVPGVSANATNTVALCGGYVGGAWAQRDAVAGKNGGSPTPTSLAATAAAGGLAGSLLLVVTSDAVFGSVVPYLILFATLLLAMQERIGARLRSRPDGRRQWRGLEFGGVAAASIYGGYFGAGLGITLLAVLMLFNDRSIHGANALKAVLALAVNATAAAFLATSGHVAWTLVAVMAPASLVGGHVGGRLAGRIQPAQLRRAVVAFGTVVAAVYLGF